MPTIINIRRLSAAFLGILLPLAVVAVAPKPLLAQDSVVDASRKAKEQKAKEQGKPVPKVFTNDSLAEVKGTISVVGAAPVVPAAADAIAVAPAPGAAKVPATDAKVPVKPANDEASWRARFAAARQAESEDARELSILQREFNLKQQQYYSDPNQALREQYSRKDLDDTQAQIDAKKAAVEKDKAVIAALEDELRKTGGDPGWARDDSPPPVPQQPPSNGQPNNP